VHVNPIVQRGRLVRFPDFQKTADQTVAVELLPKSPASLALTA
jgi:hypothetical protein